MREDWIEIELGRVGKVVSGGTPKTSVQEYWADEIAWITPADLSGYGSKYISKGRKSISKLGLEKSSARLMPKNSVLFSSRAPVGYVVIAKNELATNQGFKSLVPYSIVDSEYLYYYLKFAKHIAEKNASGTTFKELSGKAFSNLPFKLAPIPEQRAIVAKIEQLFSELDNGIANLKAAKDKLEIYRQAVLKKAFEGELTKEWRKQQTDLPTADELLEQIKEKHLKYYENQLTEWDQEVAKWEANGKKGKKPSKPKKAKCLSKLSQTDLDGHSDLPTNWKWVKLDEVTQRASKIKKDSLNPDDSFKYFDIGGIDNNKQRILSFKTYKWNEAPSRAQQIVKFGDTLFSTVRTYLKNIGQVDKPEYHNEICSTGFTVIRGIDSKINPKFLFYLTTSEFFIQPLNKLQVGTSYPAVKDDDVFNQPFPLCSEKEQTQIVQEIESRLSLCDNILANIEEGLEKSEALRQSILKQAFEGKLLSEEELEACRQEPDWEPAEKLLERIKNEKLVKA